MSIEFDITFDVRSDTPKDRDPDAHSPTLRRYHKALWSKPLPNGKPFNLSDATGKAYLHHASDLGEFFLSSDGIGTTLTGVKKLFPIIGQFPKDEIDTFYTHCCTIGGYILFPSNKMDNKMTINGFRGFSPRLRDRIDLTLECIRRHYLEEASPLSATLQRYSDYFDLFGDFRGYVDFFLMQDLVASDYSSIKFFLPFDTFDSPPLPESVEAYRSYKIAVTEFISGRNQRISQLNPRS